MYLLYYFLPCLVPSLRRLLYQLSALDGLFFLELTPYLLLLYAESNMEADLYNQTFLKEVLLLRVKHAPANTSLLLFRIILSAHHNAHKEIFHHFLQPLFAQPSVQVVIYSLLLYDVESNLYIRKGLR